MNATEKKPGRLRRAFAAVRKKPSRFKLAFAAVAGGVGVGLALGALAPGLLPVIGFAMTPLAGALVIGSGHKKNKPGVPRNH
jgi:hypothetical protein